MIKVRKGLQGGRYRPLGDQDIEKIHKTSLRVFAEVGVQVNFAEARELFRNTGAEVDDAGGIVKMAGDLVEELIHKAPPVVQLCGREENGELDCEVGGDKVYMGTGGARP